MAMLKKQRRIDTDNRIKDAAIELFAEHGYDEAIQLINRMNYRIYRDESYEIIDKEGNEINKLRKIIIYKKEY